MSSSDEMFYVPINVVKDVTANIGSSTHELEILSTGTSATVCHSRQTAYLGILPAGVKNYVEMRDEDPLHAVGDDFDIKKYRWEIPEFLLLEGWEQPPPPPKQRFKWIRRLKCPKWLRQLGRGFQSPAAQSHARSWSTYGRI